VEIVTKVKDAIMAFSMFAKPHGYVTPLSLTARLGLAEMCHFLIQKGALVAGHPVAPKSPLQEALGYARSEPHASALLQSLLCAIEHMFGR
jgi:hypothetical protein